VSSADAAPAERARLEPTNSPVNSDFTINPPV
jgi:hypothetical protein